VINKGELADFANCDHKIGYHGNSLEQSEKDGWINNLLPNTYHMVKIQ